MRGPSGRNRSAAWLWMLQSLAALGVVCWLASACLGDRGAFDGSGAGTVSNASAKAGQRALAAQVGGAAGPVQGSGGGGGTRAVGTHAGTADAGAADAGSRPRPTGAELVEATEITPDEILAHIEVLASDTFQGREAGTEGEERARKYIISALADQPALQPAGDDGGWLQAFPFKLQGEPAEGHNIIARLPGTDPELSEQVIVIGAHYDHVGYGFSHNALDLPGPVHNGADDNASGSAVLLDLATSLAGAHWRPRHTVLFQWYSGEELGLLGSRYWVDHPLVPLDRVIFMINMDMVGRMVAHTLVVGGTGTSPGLTELARGFCDELGLKMIDDPPGTAPSDNTSFYKQGIPALFLFTGLHDDYHTATDDAHRINPDGAADVGRLAQKLLVALDARDERPAFTLAPGEAYMFRPALYTGAAFVDGAGGPPRVAVVIPGSPADQAGLKEGQLVLKLDGEAVADLRSLEDRLAARLSQARPLRFEVRAAGASAAAPQLIEVQPVVK